MLLTRLAMGFQTILLFNEGNDYSIGWGVRSVTGYVRVKER